MLVVHGGPGAGCNNKSRCFFDPERYRIILFDQRGAGRSTPHAELEGNNTAALVADMELLREFLGVEQWLLFGGSWGSTLSLVYAQSYPQRVLGMILRGVFLCRDSELDWLYRAGASRIYPDYWQDFLQPVARAEGGDLLAAYHRLLTGDNELARMGAAKAWAQWEARCATLHPSHETEEHFADPHVALSLARIEAHYFINQGFLSPGQLLANADKLAGIPGIIVHGRYDMICPLDNALALHEAWPDSDLQIIRDAGHASSEPGTVDALVHAGNDMARRFRPDAQ